MKKRIHVFVVLLAASLVTYFCNVGFPTGDTVAENKEEQAVYVGWEKCKACHSSLIEAYRGFKRTRNFRL